MISLKSCKKNIGYSESKPKIELDWKQIFADLYDPQDMYKLNIAMTFFNLIEGYAPLFVAKAIGDDMVLEYVETIKMEI